MRPSLRHVVRLAAVLLLPWLAALASAESPTNDAAVERRQLNLAAAMILARQPERAMTQILNPLIARYVAAYGQSKERVYSTSDPWETVYYLTAAARERRNASVLDSTWADAYRIQSAALIHLGRIDDARDVLLKAIALSPINASYWNELGFTYQTQKNHPKSLEVFQRAAELVALHPEGPARSEQFRRAWRGQAFSLIERGQLDEAEALYKRCLALEPNDSGARHQLEFLAWRRQNDNPQQVVTCTKVGLEGNMDNVPNLPVRCRN